jgi:hypothetical protein
MTDIVSKFRRRPATIGDNSHSNWGGWGPPPSSAPHILTENGWRALPVRVDVPATDRLHVEVRVTDKYGDMRKYLPVDLEEPGKGVITHHGKWWSDFTHAHGYSEETK